MLSINSNIQATRLGTSINQLQQSLEQSAARLSTGKRIISAKDDPAGTGILSTLKTQAQSYVAVQKNLSAGLSLMETASSSLAAQQDILKQMKSLATEAASGTLSADQRTALQNTFAQLQTQLDAAVNNATIFGQNLTGAAAANVTLQVGINAGDTFTVNSARSDATTLGVAAADIDLTDATNASAAMTAIDTAVGTLAGNQSVIGAQQNGLMTLAKTQQEVANNIEATVGRIEDVDVAAETANLQKLQAKMQLSVAMAGIINQFPAFALQLLR